MSGSRLATCMRVDIRTDQYATYFQIAFHTLNKNYYALLTRAWSPSQRRCLVRNTATMDGLFHSWETTCLA